MDVFIARSAADIRTAFDRLSRAEAVGCDTETSSLSPHYGKLYSIQFSDGAFNVLVPLSEGTQLGELKLILEKEEPVKIFHNAKFDVAFLASAGVAVRGLFDTMVAERVLTRGADQSASLAETLYRYFAVDLDKSHRKSFNRNWDGDWTDDLVSYALSDVVHLTSLMREQVAWLDRLGLRAEFDEQMRKIVQVTTGGTPGGPP